MTVLYTFVAILAGISFSVQGPTNAALGKKIGKLQSALVSFFCGWLLLTILVIIIGDGTISMVSEAKLWQLLGGLYGVYGVVVTIIAIPKLGTALTLALSMFGQLLAGVAIDKLGWFGTNQIDVTLLRLIGIFIVLLGIILIYRSNSDEFKTSISEKNILLILLTISCGMVGAVQSPTNAALSRIVGKLESTYISFFVGFFAILFINLIFMRGRLPSLRGKGIKLWMVIGGIYGVAGVFLNNVCAPILGVALLVISGMFGQLAGGLVVDSFGIFGAKKITLNRKRIGGIILIALGMIAVQNGLF